ncbi:MAG: glycosyltransferase family 39 protein, partial [Bacteroidales bacterium]|nr:glycosyltransferase family 39 protein [Bacteroidales bacterium]
MWLGISLLVCLFFAWSVSPFYVNEGGDSAVFKIIGQGILNGKLPYRDLFDHKGPVIFYLNACGLGLAGGKVGLLGLNVLFLAATLYLVYRISRLFSSAKKSFWISLLSLLYWAIFSEGGNLTEGYALPAVALSLYLVLRLCQSPQKTFAGYFIGLCFAWMLLLRMNDAVMLPGGLFAGFFLYGLIQKRYKQILVATLWFLAGAATLILSFVFYFAAQNALADFWYGNFTFSYLYSKQNSHAFINYGNLVVCLLLVISCIWAVGKKKENRFLYF